MEHYVGLDVSLKETHACVVDGEGNVIARCCEATHPELLAKAIRGHAPHARRVVLETGGFAHWLHGALSVLDVPVVIVDARQAKAALKCRVNKTDANDAEGLAQLARTGWYREVMSKSETTRLARAHLLARGQLVRQRRDIDNQVRAILRGFGLKVGAPARGGFEARVWELIGKKPLLEDALGPLLAVRRSLDVNAKDLEARIKAITAASPVCQRLMTVPGVGPMTALSFVTAIDDPARFEKSSSVGAYLGLTPRRHQSGEADWSGRISKHGDALARHMLFEAANALLTRTRKWSAPKAWAARLVKKVGGKKARVALARKLAVIMHRLWADSTEFCWTKTQTA